MEHVLEKTRGAGLAWWEIGLPCGGYGGSCPAAWGSAEGRPAAGVRCCGAGDICYFTVLSGEPWLSLRNGL